ncbi:N-terminal EF-hand calcium-binding protein 1-like isoform X2 [Hyla sarda]|uniref:N-terminal EF-hand calcium-binding protein 1-like isoform X2 n=1 Tax=Hyla sarda TaxID=327740 RepID=UPI0024C38E69|nr:N-terminal EF-hand calcium-binding protein 1-like isoform X2 [Hyla sarda]
MKMMSCTELITMCLLSAKQFPKEKPARAPLQPSTDQDLSIFRDIFRRADKNDDGNLSLDEFQSYFSDDVLNQEDLRKMFIRIDSRQSNNMDTELLCDYFSEYLGEYKNVLAALQNLNVTILTAMDKTKTDYGEASQTEQFVTRFLLRETMNQLQSLHNSLESALEAVESQTRQDRQDLVKPEPKRVGRKCNRRIETSPILAPTDAYSALLRTDGDTQWSVQINRLEQLIDKLECTSPRLHPVQEDVTSVTSSASQMEILVSQRQLSVSGVYMGQFRMSLKSYSEFTAAQEHCLHVSTRDLHSQTGYVLYEIWRDEESWKSHLQSAQSKTFQRAVIDCLESPEQMKTMLFPADWWSLQP